MSRMTVSLKLGLTEELDALIRKAAASDGRPIAQWVRRALVRAVELEEEARLVRSLETAPEPPTAALQDAPPNRPPLTRVPPPGKTAAQKLAEWESPPPNPALRK